MGEPVKIIDLAKDLIALSGLRVGDDIEIEITGTRAGEKLFEELALEEEGAERTRHPKVFIGRIKPHPSEEVAAFVRELEAVSQTIDAPTVRAMLQRLIPEYRPAPARPPSGVPSGSARLPVQTVTTPSSSQVLRTSEV
jgi:FlaA1/EpsC-like NDP-sugar epimerase